jgi:nucleoside-diphosphate-sugar epimerase
LTPLVHVGDVVEGIILAGERGIPGETYLVTSENSFELDTIRELVLEALGINRLHPYVPTALAKAGAIGMESLARVFGFAPVVTYRNIESTVADRVFSISKAKKELGYSPKKDLREGIKETVAWFQEQGLL